MPELLKQIERANDQNRRVVESRISLQLELPFVEFEKSHFPKRTLLQQIEEADGKNRRNVHVSMEQLAKRLNDMANGILPKRERDGLREVSTKDGGRELIPVRHYYT